MNKKIHVFGHTTPDTDSICSSIAYVELKKKLGYINIEAYMLGKPNNETKFVLQYFNIEHPQILTKLEKDSEVILIDHNERNQTIKCINDLKILEIIDHHRFSDVHTNEPLFIRAEPVGCSSTIIYKMYKENNIIPEKNIAGIMLSAILSDTIKFTSPTCTEIDKKLAMELVEISGVNLDEYAQQLFEASSNLDGFSEKEILAIDRKKFTFGDIDSYISQVNTMDYKSLENKKQNLIDEMEKFIKLNNAKLAILMITDIPKNGSELLVVGEESEFAKNIFGINENENSIYLDGVISRKKQIVPFLSNSSNGVV